MVKKVGKDVPVNRHGSGMADIGAFSCHALLKFKVSDFGPLFCCRTLKCTGNGIRPACGRLARPWRQYGKGRSVSIQTGTAIVGMCMGFALMILSMRATAPREFLPVGIFLLLTGFCKVLKARFPRL